jgi:hypothetical protein
MLRHRRLALKSAFRLLPRHAGNDMALASTLVFFGVFPIILFTGLLLVQALGALSH